VGRSVRIEAVSINYNAKQILLVVLMALLGVLGVTARPASPSMRAGRPGDDTASGSCHRRLQEPGPGRSSYLEAPSPSSPSGAAEFADIDEEESDDDEEGQAPVAGSGDVRLLFGSAHPPDATPRLAPPTPPRAPLFLLCGHLVC
jgi:hypothetical protein